MSSVPLGENLIAIQRGLTTSSTAIFIPFITQELFQTGAALYYGLNALSNNMILCDRKQLKNPNGLILGTPGSGKSFAAKREMTNAFLITDDDIIICDPEAEYFSLVQRLDGQVIRLSPTGKGIDGKPQYVNPMDINLNYSEDDSPLALKSDFILSLCELVIGGKEGLQPVDKTVIDRAVRNVYRPFLADPDPEKMPILGDLFFLPAGRVHSIGAGAFIAEIQQTSDITYRIYDFNRKDADGNTRELHTELAKGAIDYTVLPDYRTKYEQVQDRETELVSCPYFTTSLCDLTAPLTLDYAALDSFVVVICVEGKGMIADDSGNEMPIHQGETVLLPATVKSLRVVPEGKLKMLTSCIK